MNNNDLKFIFKGQQDHAFENYVKYYIIKNELYCKFKNGECFKVRTGYETEDSGTLFASMDKNWDIFDTAIRYVIGRGL